MTICAKAVTANNTEPISSPRYWPNGNSVILPTFHAPAVWWRRCVPCTMMKRCAHWHGLSCLTMFIGCFSWGNTWIYLRRLNVSRHVPHAGLMAISIGRVRYGKSRFTTMRYAKMKMYGVLRVISSLIPCAPDWLNMLATIRYGMRFGCSTKWAEMRFCRCEFIRTKCTNRANEFAPTLNMSRAIINA